MKRVWRGHDTNEYGEFFACGDMAGMGDRFCPQSRVPELQEMQRRCPTTGQRKRRRCLVLRRANPAAAGSGEGARPATARRPPLPGARSVQGHIMSGQRSRASRTGLGGHGQTHQDAEFIEDPASQKRVARSDAHRHLGTRGHPSERFLGIVSFGFHFGIRWLIRYRVRTSASSRESQNGTKQPQGQAGSKSKMFFSTGSHISVL